MVFGFQERENERVQVKVLWSSWCCEGNDDLEIYIVGTIRCREIFHDDKLESNGDRIGCGEVPKIRERMEGTKSQVTERIDVECGRRE